MTLLDVLGFAGTALVRHRLRAGLSLLGVAIGVAAVVLLTALGEGARQYVVGQFESLGTNLLIVIPGRTETAGALPGIGKPPNDLTLADAEAIRRALPGAQHVVPVVVGTESVAHRERNRQVVVVGTNHEFLEVRHLEVALGQFLPVLEEDDAASVVVLGSSTARELFPGQSALGQRVRIGDWRMRVVGVLRPRGTQMGVDTDQVAIVPIGTGMRLFNRTSLFRLLIDVGAFDALDEAKERVLQLIVDRHDEEDVTCLTQDSVLGSFAQILQALTAALAGIAAVSLTVAGIGIMNVMLVSVSERTAEVGLLKALGATSRQVLALFLAEAILLSTAGGLGGVAVAAGLTQVAAWQVPDFPFAAPVWAIAAGLAVAVVTGGVFGVLPALHATRLDPVAALHGSAK